ncbi:hypothetical protein ACH0AH_11115 [Microbacterium paludicola]|uniref:Primosomal protein n=1 Tax=Microbacterium paludicola TaxID=300019 RepID=A0A4Y9FRT4_9MICO|nr:hypothetical protein [Microbacterium paludicola]MBF0817360.1 hypothetical protein [Microbacterium paludicola]TFU31592.1 hypothetical protein E4U02_13165 [Microbacterium paludicola]
MRIPDPELPEELTPRDLPSAARNELKTLSKENAERVARHLAMAARTLDEDPALAHEHAQAAVRHAGRVAVARETLAITAYTVGDFALALRELRTHRRITGRDNLIALIVDSERGLGRPERALEEGRAVDRAALPTAVRVELAIAMSGARLDLGDTQLALVELDIPELDPDRAFEWSPGLFAARATVLEDLGLADEAAEWHRRAEIAADALGHTLDEDEFDVIEIDDADTEELPDEALDEDADEQAAAESSLEDAEEDDAPVEDPAEDEPAEDEPAEDEPAEDEFTVEDEVAEILAEIDEAPEAEPELEAEAAVEPEPEPEPEPEAEAEAEADAEDDTSGEKKRGDDGQARPDGALF